MTEAEWLGCTDRPLDMLEHLYSETEGWTRRLVRWATAASTDADPWRKPIVHRRLYLLACGIRQVQYLAHGGDDGGYPGHDIEERFADGLVTLDELLADNPERRWWWQNPWHLMSNVIRVGYWSPPRDTMWPAHCDVFREVFGNPFRRPRTAGWRTVATVGLARQMYASRDFFPMPILADALEEVGCDDTDILSHCRGGGPHVRGCWVIDLLTGRN